MIDPRFQKPVVIGRMDRGGGAFYLLRDRVPEIRAVLDANAVPYWMDAESLSMDGGPFISRVVLSVKADVDQVQRLLDALP